MADFGDQLEDHEERGREDGAEMDGHADAVDAGSVGIPLALRGAVGEAARGRTSNVQVGEAGKGEAEKGACEDDI